MSLASLFRLLKSPFAGYLDQMRGYDLFDTGVRFVRSCSVQVGDYGERGAAFAEQIWKSKKTFRNPDGTVNITLRVRNRLTGGPLQDAIRCWKEEFFLDPEDGNFAPENVISSSATTGPDATIAPNSVASGALPHISAAPEFLLNDELWGDAELELGEDWDLAGSGMNWTT